jgi:beta-lactamase class C
MRFLPSLLLAACLSLTSLANAANGPSPASVEQAARQVMQQYNIPGMAIAITNNGRQQFYNFGIASRDTRQPVSSDTLFELGSISKTLTATLATYAQATGTLSLDDKTRQYLPQLAGTPFGEIALRHLATHSAGGFPLQVPDAVQDEQQLIDYLKAWKPQYAPGSQRTYANPSVGMLGMLTARALNMPFASALQQYVFSPLGLTNTYLDIPADKRPLYAQGYDKQDAPIRLRGGVLGDEAYGVKSSSKDVLRFIEANLNPQQLGDPLATAVTQTHVGYLTFGPVTQDLLWEQYPYPVKLSALLAGNANTMAYETQPATPLDPVMPAQQNVWINKTGSTNGFGGYVAFIPGQARGIVILANKNYPNEARVKLAYALLGEVE